MHASERALHKIILHCPNASEMAADAVAADFRIDSSNGVRFQKRRFSDVLAMMTFAATRVAAREMSWRIARYDFRGSYTTDHAGASVAHRYPLVRTQRFAQSGQPGISHAGRRTGFSISDSELPSRWSSPREIAISISFACCSGTVLPIALKYLTPSRQCDASLSAARAIAAPASRLSLVQLAPFRSLAITSISLAFMSAFPFFL